MHKGFAQTGIVYHGYSPERIGASYLTNKNKIIDR
jgi:hypothetical protein